MDSQERNSALKRTAHLVGVVVFAFALGIALGSIMPLQISGWGWIGIILIGAGLVLDVFTLLRNFWKPHAWPPQASS
jgi:hypothetical protein